LNASETIFRAVKKAPKKGITAVALATKTGYSLGTVRTTLTLLTKGNYVTTVGNVQTGRRGRPANLYAAA
jgi:predicted ArsR family transcriptional regulator